MTDPNTPLDDLDPDPWRNHPHPLNAGGPEFGRLAEALRMLQDRFCGSRPPDEVVAALAARVEEFARDFDAWQVPERQTAADTRADLPGRGNPMLPPLVIDSESADEIAGRITFRRAHLGGNDAAHGGMIPLLFDEILGRLANAGNRPIARTAYLNVNYRHITRLGIEHVVTGRVDHLEGRKRRLSARLLTRDGTLCADADALFVELRPGQP